MVIISTFVLSFMAPPAQQESAAFALRGYGVPWGSGSGGRGHNARIPSYGRQYKKTRKRHHSDLEHRSVMIIYTIYARSTRGLRVRSLSNREKSRSAESNSDTPLCAQMAAIRASWIIGPATCAAVANFLKSPK